MCLSKLGADTNQRLMSTIRRPQPAPAPAPAPAPVVARPVAPAKITTADLKPQVLPALAEHPVFGGGGPQVQPPAMPRPFMGAAVRRPPAVKFPRAGSAFIDSGGF